MKKYNQRTLEKILSEPTPDKKAIFWHNGKLYSGEASTHRTRTGMKYNRLIRLLIRLEYI